MVAQRSADPRVGTVIHGRYEIVRLIAEGAMGAVYEGVRVQLGKPVAVKFLHRAYAKNEDSQKRFEREAVAMSKLSHPNCVSVIDFGVDEGPYIVMDLVHGSTLRELIDEGTLTPQRCVTIMVQMLAGLGHAHENQLVHRDVKPANVKVESDDAGNDYVRVLDFGLAKLTDPGADQLTEEGIVAGTTTYMSPEHAFGAGIDSRSDLYSAGLVFFEMLSGSAPFKAETAAGMLLMHRDKVAPRLSEVRGDDMLSESLEQVLATALAKDKNERFQTADEFIRALEKVPERGGSELSGFSLRGSVVSKSGTRRVSLAPPWQRARSVWLRLPTRSRVATFAAGGLLGLSALAVPLWARPAEPPPAPKAVAAAAPASPAPEPEPAEPVAAAPTPIDPADVARAEELLLRGEHDAARMNLEKLIALAPQNAELHYLVGCAYFEGRRWADALNSYGAAIHYDPEYKSRPLLNRNVIRALRGKRSTDQARELIVGQLQLAALPHLQDFHDRARDKETRAELKALIDELSPPEEPAAPAEETSSSAEQ